MALGMKCGGTAGDRAGRLFQVKGVAADKIPAKLLAGKGKKRKREGGEAGANGAGGEGGNGTEEALAKTEARLAFLAEQMADVVDATKRYVEKRQTQLVEERDAEIEEEESGALVSVLACSGNSTRTQHPN